MKVEIDDHITILTQLNWLLFWLRLTFSKFVYHTYDDQFLYLHFFNFNILINHDFNVIF